jgi:hypothetical protein
MFSFGRWRDNARTTVSPPMPESNTPMGLELLMVAPEQ